MNEAYVRAGSDWGAAAFAYAGLNYYAGGAVSPKPALSPFRQAPLAIERLDSLWS